MITPPTDRLHKFLTVFGILLIFLSCTYPLKKYNDAEIGRIAAIEKVDAAKYFTVRFAQKVKEETSSIYNLLENGKLKANVTKEQHERALQEFMRNAPEVRKLEREMHDSFVQANKELLLAKHFEYMKKIWIGIGVFCFVLGVLLTLIGLKQWISQPKSTR